MKCFSTYSVKLLFYSRIFKETVAIYRRAVDFFINVCLAEWNTFSDDSEYVLQMQDVERMCHQTSGRPCVKYDTFNKEFYKFPSYLRRGAIVEAIGKVSSCYVRTLCQAPL